MSNEEKKEEAPGQNKVFNIIVNTRPKTFTGKEISFRQVVELAYENPVFNDQVEYTVSYSKGEDKKPKGTLTDGVSVHVKEGMVFDVERANRS
jgi:hypothetical protein